MRIALLHNWSTLGCAVAERLLADPAVTLALLGAPTDAPHEPLIALTAEAGVAAATLDGLGAAQILEPVQAFGPDLILTGTFPARLPRAVWSSARLAACNVHPSLLPAHRGAQPEFWAIRDGSPVTGVTVHALTDRLDAGPILAQTEVAIGDEEALLDLVARLDVAAADLVAGVVDAFRRGHPPAPVTQDEGAATPAPRVQPCHLAVDWRAPAASIRRLVRAADVVFEVHTTLAGARLHVAGVAPAGPWERPLAPGELALDHAGERLFVGTGDDALELTRVGGEPGYAFARQGGLPAGARLGGSDRPALATPII